MPCLRRLLVASVCSALAVFAPQPHARGDDQALLAGVAAVDITPAAGQTLWGYSTRTHGATGVLDPLMAKAVVVKTGKASVAIVALDLGRTPEEPVLEKIRARVKAECGVEDLFVTASHTHHAPVLDTAPDAVNPYAEKVGQQIGDVICAAAKELTPVRIGVGRGAADFAHNRRKILPDGRVAMQWRNVEREPTAPVDPEVAVIRLDRPDGSPLAVLFNYTCHPVVMGDDNYLYSADYVGPACALVETELKTKCLFLQGACGNINPYADKTPLDQGGVEAMRQMGRGVGEIVVKVARETTTAAPKSPSLQFSARKIPVRVRWDFDDPEVRATLGKAYGARFNNYVAKTVKNNQLQCALTILVIDHDIALVGMPGEIFVQFQTLLKKEAPFPNTFFVGYTNGYYAYFPTIRDAAAGGYGGKTATYVEPGAGERLTNDALITLYKLADQLHDKPRAEDFKLLEYNDVRAKAARQ